MNQRTVNHHGSFFFRTKAQAPLPGRVLVTGATSGIGWALSLHLAQLGIPVIAVGRDRARLQALAAQHGSIATEALDLSHIAEIDGFAARLTERFPDIGSLVNNAGIQYDLRLDAAGYAATAIAHEVDVNLVAPIVLTHALLPQLSCRKQSLIVNISSVLAYQPKATAAVYSATKAGLHLFTQALRVQTHGSGIKVVHAVMPLVDTPMTCNRGAHKLSASAAARALVHGLYGANPDVHIGQARWAPTLQRWVPEVLARILQRA